MSPEDVAMQSTAVPWTWNDCTPAKVRSTAPVPDADAGDDGGDAVPVEGVRCVAVSRLELEEQADAAATSPTAHSINPGCPRRRRCPLLVIETPQVVVRRGSVDHGPAGRRR